ncbi:MAG: MoxR family ATPase [Lachnospiraceae bacterium]|nr:MoxR family ATPase [Lachnospiraceae bacterium]
MNNAKTADIINEVKKVIHGKDDVIRKILCAVIAGGHVLLEDIPGVGKTTLAVAFSKALSLDYRRVQLTPDVTPADLLGFKLFDQASGSFKFQEGSIYTNLFLADEINRTSPKTQSALLEAMEERQVTVEGQTRLLSDPFFVMATQNPYGSAGTQRLPESQMDRFMVSLTMGYPDHKNAVAVLKGDSAQDLKCVEPKADAAGLKQMMQEVRSMHVEESLYDYIVAVTEETRSKEFFSLGLSPRGSIALTRMAKAWGYVSGRDYVLPEDVKDVFESVAGHRVQLDPRARAVGTDVSRALHMTIEKVAVPVV